MNTNDFDKVICLGGVPEYYLGRMRTIAVFCHIVYKENCLSITGVVGPQSSGNCVGSCGQIANINYIDGKPVYTIGGHDLSELKIPDSSVWFEDPIERVKKFLEIWDEWHLNDLQAGTRTQQSYLRGYCQEHGIGGLSYDKAVNVLGDAGLNPDPENGYKYGHEWLYKAVPEDVLDFLRNLPDSHLTPAWV